MTIKYYSIISLSVIVLASISISFYFHQNGLFDKKSFDNKKYTTNEIAFFEDIAFWDSKWIRKWETEIKVQIDTTNGISKSDIKEVDNVIEILSPLIVPLKITRVNTNGNLIVHLNYSIQTYKNAQGWTIINDMSKPIPIKRADIYVIKHINAVIMHEFLHALGIWHPQKRYPFYTAIGKNDFVILEAQKKQFKYPFYVVQFKTWSDYDEFSAKFYNNLSEQEKKALKMLYSSDFECGLLKRFFVYKTKK